MKTIKENWQLALTEEGRAGGFTLFSCVFLFSCGCLCSSFLPRGAVGLSVVCDCGISWVFSPAFLLTSDFKGFEGRMVTDTLMMKPTKSEIYSLLHKICIFD